MKKVIKELFINETVVNKSRFIALLCPLVNIGDSQMYLKEATKTFKDATHYTYAFVFEGYEKCSDDGEPSKTAGVPLLNLLKNNDFKNTLIIVIRYYGGVKLGVGPLLRAYVECGAGVLLKATTFIESPSKEILINVPISKYDQTQYYLKNRDMEIINTTFNGTDVDILINVSLEQSVDIEKLYNITRMNDSYILSEVKK